MIEYIAATNYLGHTIRMELTRPQTSGFVIFDVEGLGPPKANVNIGEVVNLDGGLFNSSRAVPRNILLKLKYLGQPLIEDSRQESYRFFPLQKPVTITVKTDRRLVETLGYVESNDAVIFSAQSYTQISILCPMPYFKSVSPQVTVFSGDESLFEFPFSNESLTENLIIFSERTHDTIKTIMYTGEVETGIVITIHATGEVLNPAVHNMNTNESIFLNMKMLEKDDIIISTVPGNKYIRLLRGGMYTNILNYAVSETRLPSWFKLAQGNNLFAYTADAGEEYMAFNIKNDVLFEGV